jgi:hypothetical protein
MTTYSGWQLDVKVGTTTASITGSSPSAGSVQGVQRVSYDYSQALERKEATGQRTVYAITEGTLNVTGNLEFFWTGSGTDAWSRGAAETGSLTTYHIGIYPNGAVSGQPYICIASCKFGASRKQHRPGANLMTDTVDFIGTNIYTGSVP